MSKMNPESLIDCGVGKPYNFKWLDLILEKDIFHVIRLILRKLNILISKAKNDNELFLNNNYLYHLNTCVHSF